MPKTQAIKAAIASFFMFTFLSRAPLGTLDGTYNSNSPRQY